MVCSLLSACPCNGDHAGRVTLPWRRPKGRPHYRRGGEKVSGTHSSLGLILGWGTLEEARNRIQDSKRMRPRIGAHPANSSFYFAQTFQGFSRTSRLQLRKSLLSLRTNGGHAGPYRGSDRGATALPMRTTVAGTLPRLCHVFTMAVSPLGG